MKNVFISAHELSPILGSECRTAWNLVNLMSRDASLTVFCAATNQMGTNNYQKHIQNYSSSLPESLKIIFVEQPRVTKFLALINKIFFSWMGPIGLPLFYFIGVRFWEKRLFTIVKKHIKQFGPPDCIHHLNHISFREPGYLWKLPYKFIWGPVSGIQMLNLKMLPKDLSFFESLLFKLRNIFNLFTRMSSRRVKLAAKKADHIFVVTEQDYLFFRKLNNSVSFLMDVGINNSENMDNPEKNKKIASSRKVFFWAGRIDTLKSLDILISAIDNSAILKKYGLFDIYGDGPLMKKIKEKVLFLGIDNVTFFGDIPYLELSKRIHKYNFLIHTSIKEAGSSIVSEALSFDIPFISHNSFGMPIYLQEGMGLGIELISIDHSKFYFQNSLEKVVQNSEIERTLVSNIKMKKKQFTWRSMAKQIIQSY